MEEERQLQGEKGGDGTRLGLGELIIKGRFKKMGSGQIGPLKKQQLGPGEPGAPKL